MKKNSEILMVRPINFGFNEQTAASNAFQNVDFAYKNKEKAQQVALKEFDNLAEKLETAGIGLTIVDDSPHPITPDSIFPNNWISFHEEGQIVLYPMQAENRRLERRPEIVEMLKSKFAIEQIIDLSDFENEGKFLEGTGSMVLDRHNKIAYACLSPRTQLSVLEEFGKKLGYENVAFSATDRQNKEIYHTNVLMCVGEAFVVICLEAIKNDHERQMVEQKITASGKKIIEISLEQMNQFAGNMIELFGGEGENLLVMSSSAYHSLTSSQKEKLQEYSKIIHADLTMIEGNGGGSARCMIAEICCKKLVDK